MDEFECFCGDTFDTREELIQHNVEEHDMSPDESRQKVIEKYPGGA
jgi:hypothetical protein